MSTLSQLKFATSRVYSAGYDINNISISESSEVQLGQEETLVGDFTWYRNCREKSPCIALLSASHHEGIVSEVDPKTLLSNGHGSNIGAHGSLEKRILLRQGYCKIFGCDVIIDYNQYNRNRSMWLSDYGKSKVGQMPPHWNKVAALQRWLPHFDAILLMDMDTIWVDFSSSVYNLYEATSTIYFNGGVGLVLIKKGIISNCVVDSWWYYGTSPGCRYFKYPQNHKGQTQNLDMPWFWYSLLKCAEIYEGGEPYECLNPCNGPAAYVDHLAKDPNYNETLKLWIHDCYGTRRGKVKQYTNAVESKIFHDKHVNLEMQWGNRMNFSDSIKNSITVHCKDQPEMTNWINKTVEVLQSAGCHHNQCKNADIHIMQAKLHNWSQLGKWN